MKRGKNSNTTILHVKNTNMFDIEKLCFKILSGSKDLFLLQIPFVCLFVQEFLSHFYVNFAKDKKIPSIFVLWLNFSFTNIILSSLKDFLHFEIEFYSLNIALNVLKFFFQIPKNET